MDLGIVLAGSVDGWWLIIQGAVWSLLVVETTVLLTEDLGFKARGKELPIQEFVTEPAVEALDEAVLPGCARLNIACLDLSGVQVGPDRPGDKLGTVVGANILWMRAIGEEPLKFGAIIKSCVPSGNKKGGVFWGYLNRCFQQTRTRHLRWKIPNRALRRTRTPNFLTC